MKKRNLLCGLLIFSVSIIFLSNFPIKGVAQYYSFDVKSEVVNIYIEKDGSVSIEYWIDFLCHYGADEIDCVDIGFPNEHYNINSIKADLDGHTVAVTGPSPYVEHGVEIDLGTYAIRPGRSGQLHVTGNNPRMIYEDWENQDLASVEFSPTWFDPSFCPTFDYLEVNFYFPDNLTNGNEVKYHYEEYTSYSWAHDGDLIYTWIKENVPMQQYMFGVSFPKLYINQYLPASTNPMLIDLVVGILLTISIFGLIGGSAFLLIRYYKYYKKKYYPPKPKKNLGGYLGSTFWVAFVGVIFLFLIWDFLGDIILLISLFFVILAGFGMIGLVIFKLIHGKLAKLPYSKPDIKIDSLGVNQNLTVVEAAIIQNTSLTKVIFLIMFSLIRTGHLEIIGADPLKFEVISTEGVSKMRAYQKKLLSAVIKKGPKKGAIDDLKLRTLLVDLIRATYKKMSGYKLDATIYYYQHMIDSAWKTVKSMPTEVDWEDIEKDYEWLVLDDEFEDRSKRYLANRYYYRPYWYHRYYYHNYYWHRRPYYRYYTGGKPNMVPSERINIHTFSDSIIRGIENISNNIVSNFSHFAEKIMLTVAPVKPRSTGGRGRGGGSRGGGCACACACAGCACACAGGGR